MSNPQYFNLKKIQQIFGSDLSLEFLESEVGKQLPNFSKTPDGRALKSWTIDDLPRIGEQIGFLKKPKKPIAVSIFVTKGGVLKTSLSLNLARIAALHNIRTCVVGLDMQSDITRALGLDQFDDEQTDLKKALEQINSVTGLAQYFDAKCTLKNIIIDTDIPTLKFIAETPELVALDQDLANKNRREYWLKEKVIEPLKKEFDLIIMDCSPNWNRLITNALVASDILISPVECKINNFRNLSVFRALVQEFKNDMQCDFKHLFIPTRLSSTRKLSSEIFGWYQEHLENCSPFAIKENLTGEESSAMHLSVLEYQPNSDAAQDMRKLLEFLFKNFQIDKSQKRHTVSNEMITYR